MANEDEPGRIGFRTAADWTASDVALFSVSMSGIYDAFLTLKLRSRLEDEYIERFPYLIAFEQHRDHALVLGVAHQKRRPLYWLARTSQGPG